jgi:hypothetical protein
MRCVNCEFENMPGLAICARCGSDLNPVQVAVEPPRATRLRARTHVARWTYDARDAGQRFWRWFSTLRLSLDHNPRRESVIATLIPGLGHLLEGLRFLGSVLLILWLTFLIVAVTDAWPGAWHWTVVGMIMVHNFAIISLVGASLIGEPILNRALYSAAAFGFLFVMLYGPALWGVSRYAFVIPRDGAVLGWGVENGDGLLLQGFPLRPSRYTPGDLVVYRVDWRRTGNTYVRRGFNVDRVLAGPGDRVVVSSGTLLVNGALPSPEVRPLGPVPLPLRDIDLTLGEDEYAIFPSNIQLRAAGDHADLVSVLRRACKVPRENIRGRVLYRIRPLSRFGSVE